MESTTKDLIYTDWGLFTSFTPCTPDGKVAFKEVCRAQGDDTGKVLSMHIQSTLQQLRKAGYTVGKAPKVKPMCADEIDSLLDDLGV